MHWLGEINPPGCGGAPAVRGDVVPRRDRVAAVRGAWMQAASCGVISFLTLSRSIGKIFCTKASSCCLNSSAGYFASTCHNTVHFNIMVHNRHEDRNQHVRSTRGRQCA